ncbi:MAG: thiamine ABC transporter substrate binding subunit [Rhodospirillales bacterium]|nr:thiamine ABC transporter substrate binding subunit [Rhodospirillales bacterium]
MLRLAVPILVAALGILPARAEVLTIYTYDSFIGDWGPGPAIEEAFEARCGCSIAWTAVEDAAVLLSRLRLEGTATRADVVLGLDTNLQAEAQAEGLVQAHGLDLDGLALPFDWSDPVFVPFDYGYFAIVYDSERVPAPPASLDALTSGEAEPKLIIQDPRTSTPGLGLMLWLKAVYGEDAGAAWKGLARRTLTVTPGWGEAYGLFLEGEAPMVLSYTTSPAYHRMVEGTDRYRAIIFPEGHYMQVEVAAMSAHTERAELARDFLAFIGEPGFQATIPTGNWMYPAIELGDALPEAFRTLPRPDRAILLPPEEVRRNRSAWTREWLDAMSAP